MTQTARAKRLGHAASGWSADAEVDNRSRKIS
jgi:hypothetical protein